MVRYFATNNLSSSFSNGTSGEQNATCDLLINSLLVKIAEIIVFSIIFFVQLCWKCTYNHNRTQEQRLEENDKFLHSQYGSF